MQGDRSEAFEDVRGWEVTFFLYLPFNAFKWWVPYCMGGIGVVTCKFRVSLNDQSNSLVKEVQSSLDLFKYNEIYLE
jgi:opacity protein-like surface antigen